MPLPAQPADIARRETLRDGLLTTVDLLKRRRASEINESAVEGYIALDWMEWHGGSLRLTTTGENLCRHMNSVLARNSPQSTF